MMRVKDMEQEMTPGGRKTKIPFVTIILSFAILQTWAILSNSLIYRWLPHLPAIILEIATFSFSFLLLLHTILWPMLDSVIRIRKARKGLRSEEAQMVRRA
jgi:hypothetical protein